MPEIDWEAICEAIGDYTKTRYYFFNKVSGKILILSEYMSESRKLELREKVKTEHPGEYVPIPTITSRDSYKLMEEFISVVHDDKLKSQLRDAINKDAPFKRFKEIVFKHPEERKRWLDYRKQKLTQKATEWLKKISVI
ncbi:MAG: UPF0158 family protein [bacterium]|nr:UPF0158 family protein [bacterium]